MPRALLTRVLVISTLGIAGCGEEKSPASEQVTELDAPQYNGTPEQAHCYRRTVEAIQSTSEKFKQQIFTAQNAKQSTISLVLQRRRAFENLCQEQISCFGYEGITADFPFAFCLNQAERETG